MGRDLARKMRHVHLQVSIHAPTWGATSPRRTHICALLFQSTRPRGARPLDHHHVAVGGVVSIHAPTWGATEAPPQKWVAIGGFNPRAHVGRDALVAEAWAEMRLVSIHAPTWGATATRDELVSRCKSFNPRAHVGRDMDLLRGNVLKESFNPRAHVGRDLKLLTVYTDKTEVFQSTRPRGARLQLTG